MQNITDKQAEKAVELLKDIVNWWDEWNNSANPTELEDPPIQEAKSLLKSLSES